MGKRFTGAAAYVDSVVVEDGEVRITAAAGATRATTVVTLGRSLDVEELIAAETEAALVLAEMVDSGVEKGSAATVSGDEDEGLREGPVVGSGSGAYFAKGNAVCEAAEARVRPGVYFAKGNELPDDDGIRIPNTELKHRKARAGALIAECRTTEVSGSDDDWIRIPNGEYADLVAAARRDASFRDAFGNGLVTASNGGDGEKPCLRVDFPSFEAALRAQGLLLRDSSGHAFERPVPDDGEASVGEIDIPDFVAATTGTDTAPDSSGAVLDDGGPVEPELDIDALVAAAIEKSAPFTVSRDGETVSIDGRKVKLTYGGNSVEMTASAAAIRDLRRALSDAQRAGGLR